MRMYVSVTDRDEYEFLKNHDLKEANFWRPGTHAFRALYENELFLFKLHSPENYIVGGGFFVRYSYLPAPLVWNIFGEANGTSTYEELNRKIKKYQNKHNMANGAGNRDSIGCVILTDVFYFDEEDWIPAPDDFSMSIVQGKGYHTDRGSGKQIYEQVMANLKKKAEKEAAEGSDEAKNPSFSSYMNISTGTRRTIGNGAFQVLVTDAYERSCAITGEKILPILKAVHIKPVSDGGVNEVNNGILLRADLAGLYEAGYITIDPDYTIKVSPTLIKEYGTGHNYMQYNGKQLQITPQNFTQLPDRECLNWHNQNVFLGE